MGKSLQLLALLIVEGLAPISGCQRDHAEIPQTSNAAVTVTRVTMSPIGWLGDSVGLVVERGTNEAPRKSEDSCAGVGLYSLKESAFTLWRGGVRLCDALLRAGQSASLSRDGRMIVYSDPSRFGSVRRFELANNLEVAILSKCLPPSSAPKLSDNGEKIAVVASCDAPEAEPYLHLLNTDGLAFHPIQPHQSGTRESAPTWAPSGKYLALVRQATSGPSDIVVVDTASGTRRRIATGRAPSWSPDGKWIAFLTPSADNDSGSAISLIHPDGSGEIVIVPAYWAASDPKEHNASPLVWSPDGTQLAFPRRYSIWVVDLKNARPRVRRLEPHN